MRIKDDGNKLPTPARVLAVAAYLTGCTAAATAPPAAAPAPAEAASPAHAESPSIYGTPLCVAGVSPAVRMVIFQAPGPARPEAVTFSFRNLPAVELGDLVEIREPAAGSYEPTIETVEKASNQCSQEDPHAHHHGHDHPDRD